MIETIRLNTFETNSSSMHAITVCSHVEDLDYLKDELKRWKQKDGSYNIIVELDEDKLDDGSFTIRGYIPHKTLNDKLIYAFATICQHYNSLMKTKPYYPYEQWFSENDFKTNFDKGFYKWNHNRNILESFKEYIVNLSEHLSWKLRDLLYGNGPEYHYITKEDGKKEYVPKTLDTRPEINVIFKYNIDDDYSINPTSEDNWFSTGCYGNEEFFFACCSNYWDLTDWLLNPYNQILAGGDEMSDEQYVAQRTEAKHLLDESWEKYKQNSIQCDGEWRCIMNEGKVIWPIGG